MNVYWTDVAGGHLKAIHDYIARDSAVYARRMVDRLTTRSKQIGSFPESGRVVPEYNNPEIREVFEGPYRIIYRILAAQVDVVAVIHTAQRLPPTLP